MEIQIVNISFQEVFQRYSQKYNIFRDLYDNSLKALEIRELVNTFADEVFKIVLKKKEICYKVQSSKEQYSDLLILGNINLFKEIAKEISVTKEDLGFKITQVLKNLTSYDDISFRIGEKEYSLRESYVMGILNVTPDSFSDGGLYLDAEFAVDHALKMLDEGADFIDIGGESSRPGSDPVPADVELKRIMPVIEQLLNTKRDIIISVDTTKVKVAWEVLMHGVKIINDISSSSFEPDLLEIVSKFNALIVMMHMKGNPKTMQKNPEYEDVVSEVYDYLGKKSILARKKGIKNIIIDPGIGFGKRVTDNFEIIKRLDEFKGLGLPIMMGISRKSFLGKVLDLEINERDYASAISEAICIYNGARIIRTHNVKNAVQTKKILKQFTASTKLV